MQMTTMTTDRVRKDLAATNAEFQQRSIIGPKFYEQLVQHGISIEDTVLVDYFPDSGNTWFGHIMLRDGRVMEFDIALDDPELSTMTDITQGTVKSIAKRQLKYHSPLAVAIEEHWRRDPENSRWTPSVQRRR